MTMQPANTESPLTPQERAVAEWQAEISQADEVIGYSLIGGKDNDQVLDLLIGCPHLIEGVTFRQGDVNIAGKGEPKVFRDYVSLEALVRPDYQARFKRPRVVYNDGSTGIYRQVVKYLWMRELVTVDESLPEVGPANETRYDVSFSQPTTPGEPNKPVYIPVKLYAPEGLRKSDYTNDSGDATTYYLA